MNEPKIYIVLNEIVGDLAQWAAICEDGNCLANIIVPGATTRSAMGITLNLDERKDQVVINALGPHSKNAQAYKEHCPNGYELIFVQDINAPEHAHILQALRVATAARVQRGKLARRERRATKSKLRGQRSTRSLSAVK